MLSRLKNWLKKRHIVVVVYNVARKCTNFLHKAELNEKKVLEEQLDFFKEYTDIRTIKKMDGYRRKKQMDNLNFVIKVFKELKPLNIHPFLVAGNLIGAVRHGGFVPWDDDLDFGLTRKEFLDVIQYFKSRNAVTMPDEKFTEYTADVHLRRIDKILKQCPNQLFLDITHDQIQINYGTSILDRKSFDLFAFDFFVDDYSFEEHKKYLKKLRMKLINSSSIKDYIHYVMDEIHDNPHISLNKTNQMYYAIESSGGFDWMDRINEWIDTNVVFPLKRITYETEQLWAPNDSRKLADISYGNIMKYPNDFGIASHMGYTERYIYRNYPTVEFYLIDSFEIYHFLPLYYAFNKAGIYTKFVAEKPQNNISGKWFDFEKAVEILKRLEVRYSHICNPNATVALTTQRSNILSKYSKQTKRMRMCYGSSLLKHSFTEKEVFDVMLFTGKRMYDYYKKTKNAAKLVEIGYPKYQYYNPSAYGEEILTDEYIKSINVHNKPRLLYFPTWGVNSSIREYAEKIGNLRKDFFVIVKAHHCTFRLKEEKDNLKFLSENSDLLLGGNFDFYSVAKEGDVAICDATSNSATEVPYVNKAIKLIVVCPAQYDESGYIDDICEFAEIVRKPEKIEDAVKSVYKNDLFVKKRESILKEMYSEAECLPDKLAEIIIAIKEGKR